MEKYFAIKFKTFLQIILSLIGISAEYETYFEQFKSVRLFFYSFKKEINSAIFGKFALLKDWGIDGELNFHDNEMRGFIDVNFKKKISLFDDEMAFYVPQDILLQVIKLLAKECLNIEKDDFSITCRDNSIVIDVITSKMAAVYLYNEDITTIANIGCELSIENVDGKILRFVMSF